MKRLCLLILSAMIFAASADSKPRLYWAAYCGMSHGPYPAYWTGTKSPDAQQCEMRHVTTNGGAHRFWIPCRDMRQTDLPPILSQREILAQRVMPNGEVR